MNDFQELASSERYYIGWHEKHRIIVIKFIGDLPDPVYKSIWLTAFEFFKEKKGNRLLLDQQEIGNVGFVSRAWLVVDLVPKIKSQLSKNMVTAVISSPQMGARNGRKYLSKAYQMISGGYQLGFHSSYEDAIAWINEKDQ